MNDRLVRKGLRVLALLMVAALVGGWHFDCPCPDESPACVVCLGAADDCSAHHAVDDCMATRIAGPVTVPAPTFLTLYLLTEPVIRPTTLTLLAAEPLPRSPVLRTPSDRAPPLS